MRKLEEQEAARRQKLRADAGAASTIPPTPQSSSAEGKPDPNGNVVLIVEQEPDAPAAVEENPKPHVVFIDKQVPKAQASPINNRPEKPNARQKLAELAMPETPTEPPPGPLEIKEEEEEEVDWASLPPVEVDLEVDWKHKKPTKTAIVIENPVVIGTTLDSPTANAISIATPIRRSPAKPSSKMAAWHRSTKLSHDIRVEQSPSSTCIPSVYAIQIQDLVHDCGGSCFCCTIIRCVDSHS